MVDVAALQIKGPWPYQLLPRSNEPAVSSAVENIAAEPHAKIPA